MKKMGNCLGKGRIGEPIFTGYGELSETELESLRECVEKYSPYDFATVDAYDTKEEYDWLRKNRAANWKEASK